MALIKCKECGKEISDTLDVCIHCGCPLKNKKKDTPKIDNKKVSNKFVWLVSLLPIISVLIYLSVWYLTKSYYLGIIILILIMCIFSILFIVLDYKKLNKLGLDKNTLGINKVYNIIIPKYLFKRFRVLNQNPSYFIVWIISAIVFIVMIILRINPLFLLTDTSKYIDQVYNYKLDACSNGTVEELVNKLIINQSWQSEIDMQGNVTVTVSGRSEVNKIDEDTNILMSFDIDGEKVELTKNIYNGEEIPYSDYIALQDTFCEMINFEMPEEIEGYGYILKPTRNDRYKEMFHQLERILNEQEIDEKAYLTQISKMFIMDLYTLNDKTSSDDIGGMDFVHSNVRDKMEEILKNSVYYYLDDEDYDDSELPEVTDVFIEKIENIEYNYNADLTDSSAYQVDVSIVYKEDLGYPTFANLIFIHEGNKLSLVEVI